MFWSLQNEFLAAQFFHWNCTDFFRVAHFVYNRTLKNLQKEVQILMMLILHSFFVHQGDPTYRYHFSNKKYDEFVHLTLRLPYVKQYLYIEHKRRQHEGCTSLKLG